MQNSKLLIIVAAVLLLAGGGYFFLSGDSATEKDRGQVANSDENQNRPNNYLDFSTSEYEKAKGEGKIVMLYFTAIWCPTCRAQEPVNLEAFEELKDDGDIVIFQIHILDSETTEENEKIAEDFGVRLQHTYIILNSQGDVTFTHTGSLVKGDIIKNLLAAKS